MKEYRCKFCGNIMQFEIHSDGDDICYCLCEGQRHVRNLQNEIRSMRENLSKKEQELADYEDNNLFNKQLHRLYEDIDEFIDKYTNDAYTRK